MTSTCVLGVCGTEQTRWAGYERRAGYRGLVCVCVGRRVRVGVRRV